MAKQRATRDKRQREMDKQAKAKAKRERRQQPDPDGEAAPEALPDRGSPPGESSAELLELIAQLHRQFENAELGFDEYEQRKADLLARLPVD